MRTKRNAEAICEGLSNGIPLRQLCRELHISKSEVYRWKDDDVELAGRIARAREIGFDDIAEALIEIIDDMAEDPASRRVRAEYRLKLLAKWAPKQYGDRIDLTSSDGSMSPPKTLADFYGEGLAGK
ncbi:MAG: hypothetical protein KGM49_00520 [Sphingomonadales bacterium]|nr:hypothetical protein [Sphingomonadales bacterium]